MNIYQIIRNSQNEKLKTRNFHNYSYEIQNKRSNKRKAKIIFWTYSRRNNHTVTISVLLHKTYRPRKLNKYKFYIIIIILNELISASSKWVDDVQKVKYPKAFCQLDAMAGWLKCESICIAGTVEKLVFWRRLHLDRKRIK